MTRVLAVLSVLAVVTPASAAPAVAGSVTTHRLPTIGSEATVASCGDRVVILSKQHALLSVTRDGDAQPIPGVGGALFVLGAGDRCIVIDKTQGIVDVTGATPKVVRAVSGTLPNAITAAAQSADGSIAIGIPGSDQIGIIETTGAVRYFDLPQNDAGDGMLKPAELHLAPDLSSLLQFTRDVQLLAASPHYVWAVRVSTPPTASSYVLRIDSRTGAYRRLTLEASRRAAGLAALGDDLAVILTSNDRVLVVDTGRVMLQWELPGAVRYAAPPWSVSLVTPVPGGADIVSLKDAALWHYSRERGVLELKAQFPGRPSWITALPDRLVGINTDAAEFMTTPL